MYLVALVSAAAVLIVPCISAPTPQPNYWWNVTQWDAGCGPTACHYSFHVTAPLDGIYPGFDADCSGRDKGVFKDCTITSFQTTSGIPFVSAKLKQQPDPKHPNGVALMALSLQFTDADDGNTYNYTGHHTAQFNNGGPGGKKFKVFPTKATAIG